MLAPSVVGGGGGGTIANAINPGLNLFLPYWDQNMFTNKFNNTSMQANLTAGGETNIPAANMDRDRNPTSLPTGCNAINKTISRPLTENGQIIITWTGNAGTVTARNSSSIVSGPSLIAGQTNQYTMTISTPSYAYSTGTFIPPPSIGYQIPDSANYPKDFFASFPGADTSQLLDATVLANFQQVIKPGTFLRFMDCTGVNQAGGPPINGDTTPWLGGTQSSPVYALDLTNYSRPASADWIPNNDHNGTPPSDGMPFEVIVAMCNQLGCNLWYNINWNAAPALIQYYADYARDNLNSNLKVRWEVANEVWNFNFYSYSQACKEAGYDTNGSVNATFAGLRTSGNALTVLPFAGGNVACRYAEKIIEVSQYISTEFAAARTGGGSKPTSEMVCAWQEQAPDAVGLILDYQPAGSPGPLKNYVHVYSTAPYAGPQEIDSIYGTSFDTSLGIAPLFRALMLDTETRWKFAAETRVVAEARGLVYHPYEMGPAVQIATDASDKAAFAVTFDESPEMGTAVSYTFQAAEQFNPGIDANYYAYNGGQSSKDGSWDITPNVYGDQTNIHKFQAMKAFQAGTRILFDLDANLVATMGASAGTIVGLARRRCPGSTVSVNAPFSIVDTAAVDLQIAIADATQFTSEGTIAWTITETGGNPSTTHTTSGTCTVTRACSWAIGNPDYDVTGTYGQTINRIGYDSDYQCVFGTIACTSGYIEFDFNCGANSHFGLAPLGSLNLGSDAHSLKVDTGGGLYGGGSKIANWPSISPTDHCALLLTPSKHLFFFKNNTAYGADGAGTVTPASDVGGVDVSGVLSGLVGGLYPAMLSQGNLTKTTIRTTDAQYLYTRPANSTEWKV